MIAFRDQTVRRLGLDLIVHINQDGVDRGINPIASGSSLHTHVMKTEALKQALDLHGFDAAFGGARRDEEKSRAKERIFSFRSPEAMSGTRAINAPNSGICSTRGSARAKPSAYFRCRIGPNWMCGATSCWKISPSCRSISRKERPVVRRSGTWIMVDDERLPLAPGESAANAAGSFPHARLLSVDRRDRIRCQHAGGDRGGDAHGAFLGATGST